MQKALEEVECIVMRIVMLMAQADKEAKRKKLLEKQEEERKLKEEEDRKARIVSFAIPRLFL